VEVVGTAPTSVMVITKFVYRRSWQANIYSISLYYNFTVSFLIKIQYKKNKLLH
jgi:hypothetical protein